MWEEECNIGFFEPLFLFMSKEVNGNILDLNLEEFAKKPKEQLDILVTSHLAWLMQILIKIEKEIIINVARLERFDFWII